MNVSMSSPHRVRADVVVAHVFVQLADEFDKPRPVVAPDQDRLVAAQAADGHPAGNVESGEGRATCVGVGDSEGFVVVLSEGFHFWSSGRVVTTRSTATTTEIAMNVAP